LKLYHDFTHLLKYELFIISYQYFTAATVRNEESNMPNFYDEIRRIALKSWGTTYLSGILHHMMGR
jgi:hypothetical protein